MAAKTCKALCLSASLGLAVAAGAQQTGSSSDRQSATDVGTQSTTGARSIGAGELARNIEQYQGQRVTVTAEVDDVMGAHGFSLDADRLFVGPDVLVVIPDPDTAQRLTEDDEVTVTGKARRFVRAELDREFDWFGLTAEKWELEFKERPVIIAESVRTRDGRQLVKGGRSAATSATAATLSGRQANTVSAGQLAKNAASYYGQRVSVTAEVEDVHGPGSFTLDEDELFAGPDVLVLVPNGRQSVPQDRKVTVTGAVRRYVEAELDREFDWFQPGRQWEVEFRDRPVIVAESVKTDDGRELLERSGQQK